MGFYLQLRLWRIKQRRVFIINKQFRIVSLMIATELFALLSESMTRFGCEVNIKSMHEEGNPSICISSIITWASLNCDKHFSKISPPNLVLSCLYQLLDYALKSPNTAARKGLFFVLWSPSNAKFPENLWNGSLVWFRDRYRETNLQR